MNVYFQDFKNWTEILNCWCSQNKLWFIELKRTAFTEL